MELNGCCVMAYRYMLNICSFPASYLPFVLLYSASRAYYKMREREKITTGLRLMEVKYGIYHEPKKDYYGMLSSNGEKNIFHCVCVCVCTFTFISMKEREFYIYYAKDKCT